MQYRILQIRQQIRSIDRKLYPIPAFITTRQLYSCRSNSPSLIRLRSKTLKHVSPVQNNQSRILQFAMSASSFRPCIKSPINLLTTEQERQKQADSILFDEQQEQLQQKKQKVLKRVNSPHLQNSTIYFKQRRRKSITFQYGQSSGRQGSDQQIYIDGIKMNGGQTKDEENQTEAQPDEIYYQRELSKQAKEIIQQFKEKQNYKQNDSLQYENEQAENEYEDSKSFKNNRHAPQLQKIIHHSSSKQNKSPYGLVQGTSSSRKQINRSPKKKSTKKHIIHYNQIFLSKPRQSVKSNRDESPKQSSIYSGSKKNTFKQQIQSELKKQQEEVEIINLAPEFTKFL